MDYTFFNDVIGHIFHLFLWSTALTLLVTGGIRLNQGLQYWSALWKVTLLLCLLPLIPWSHMALPVIELPVASQLIWDLPQVWFDADTLPYGVNHGPVMAAEKAAFSQLMALTALSVMAVSIIKVCCFVHKLLRFNRAIATYQVLATDIAMLAFLTTQQKAVLAQRGVQLLKSEESTSPFATGLLRPRIVLPASFFVLPASQQRLLVEHEMTHIKRHDLVWLMFAQLSKCLFWFTPAVHLIKAKMDLALEVECDRQVLGTCPGMEKEYGSALINVVRQTQQSANLQAVFFINHQFSDLKRRITFTQKPLIEHGKNSMNKLILCATALLFSATSWALNTNLHNLMSVEDFVQIHKNATRYIAEAEAPVELSGNWVNPVKNSWVSSRFKAKQKLRYFKPHLGIDLASSQGNKIVAASDGIVIIADDKSLHKHHGNVVVIDHGEGTLSMYSHMHSFDVKKGQRVKGGELLGRVGVTGKTTGPHLHFEIIAANRHIDPATVIEFTYK